VARTPVERSSSSIIPAFVESLLGVRVILRRIATDVIPWSPRANKNMHLNLNTRITINATECDSVNLVLVNAAKCGTTLAAEL
jgi:hypothetical protein